MKFRSATTVTFPDRFGRRVASLALAILLGSFLPGCVAARGMMALGHRDPMAGAPRLKNVKNPRVEDVLAHLNQNTDRVQSWRANRVRITADGWSLAGTIAVEKGRHFRLVVTSMRGKEVDLGSNNERFWVWSRDMDPGFVTCKHENLELARQQVGIPFEPDWLMQAMGVAPIPTTGVTLQTDPANEQVRLVEHVVSAHGQPLRRTVVVDMKRGGIIVEHSLYDYNGIPIAQAKLSDHRLDKDSGVVLPHRVMIELPQNKMAMTMILGDLQVNPKSIPSVVWEMPQIRDCQLVHLDAGIPSGGIRMVTRPDTSGPVEGAGPIETVRSHDDHNFLREEFPTADPESLSDESDSFLEDGTDDPPEDSTGRARISSPDSSFENTDEEGDWSK